MTGSRSWQVLRFAALASLEVVLHNAFGVVDQLAVASIGEPEFVAAGLTAQVLFTAFILLGALAGGASIPLARYAGRKDEEPFSVTAAHLLGGAGLAAGAVAVALQLWAGHIFDAMGVDSAVAARAVAFLRLVGWSLPLMVWMEAGSQVLRARGDARSPLIIGFGALALNTALNYVLVFGWLGLPRMGLVGVGLATLLARALGTAFMAWKLLSPRHPLRVHPRHLIRLEWQRLQGLLRLALPIAVGQGLWAGGMMGYTVVYAALGTSELAAANVLGPLEGLWITFSFGFGAACLVLVGHELGRGDHEAARAVAATSLRLALGVSVLTGAMLAACAWVAGTLYPRLEPGTLTLAMLGMGVAGLLQPLKVLNMVLATGVLRSGGDVSFVMRCEVCLPVGLACAYVLGVTLGYGFLGVLAGKACEEVLKVVLYLGRYSSQRWIREVDGVVQGAVG